MAQSCTREHSGWILEKSSPEKGEVLAQAAQAGGRITVPGAFQEL